MRFKSSGQDNRENSSRGPLKKTKLSGAVVLAANMHPLETVLFLIILFSGKWQK